MEFTTASSSACAVRKTIVLHVLGGEGLKEKKHLVLLTAKWEASVMRSPSLFSTRTFYEKKKKVGESCSSCSKRPEWVTKRQVWCQIEVQSFFSRAASEGSESPIIWGN